MAAQTTVVTPELDDPTPAASTAGTIDTDTAAVAAREVVAAPRVVAQPAAPSAPATAAPVTAAEAAPEADALPILGLDHVEFWVGNAYQAAQFYRTHFGFDVIAYAGPETGVRDRASYVLRQGQVTFVLTAGLYPEGEIARHVARHGDGVRDIALRVPDADAAFAETTRRGARPALEPTTLEGQQGTVRRAAIAIYGDTVHSLIDRSAYGGVFLPRYRRVADPSAGSGQAPSAGSGQAPSAGSGQAPSAGSGQAPSAGSLRLRSGQAGRALRAEPAGIAAIDHVVGNVELGQMNHWAAFYRDVLGFTQLVHFTDEQVSTEYTALMSKVMQDGSGRVKFPINEPAPGRRKSQIDEFLEFYGGPGVQHLALLTRDIVATVRELRRRGVRFLRVPESYYTALPGRVGAIEEDFQALRELGILVDRDDEGYLLQIFTKPAQDRPTLFYEIIQRRGARGFGLGNFKALFEAIEREQRARGNL